MAQTTEIASFTALEAPNPEARSWQGCALFQPLGENPSLLLAYKDYAGAKFPGLVAASLQSVSVST